MSQRPTLLTRNTTHTSHRLPRLQAPSFDHLQSLIDGYLAATEATKEDVKIKLLRSFENALRWAATQCDKRTMDWVLGVKEPEIIDLLDELAPGLLDEDGHDLVSTALIGSSGREDREDTVRALVQRWGPRSAVQNATQHTTSASIPISLSSRSQALSRPAGSRRDTPAVVARDTSSSWSPLHFAALLSTPPLISFLLNQGYSPSVTTAKGLTPVDIVSDMPHRAEAVTLLRHTMEALKEEHSHSYTLGHGQNYSASQRPPDSDLNARRQALLERHRANKVAADEKLSEKQRRAEEASIKDAYVIERMKDCGMITGLEFMLHSYEATRRSQDAERLRCFGNPTLDSSDWEESDSDDDSDGDEVGTNTVTSPSDLPLGYEHQMSIYDETSAT